MRWVVIAAVATLQAAGGVAQAADSLTFAGPPAWVKPAAPVDPTAQKPGETSPVLLTDIQIRASAEGDSTYQERVFRIRNAFDLQSAGTLRLQWDPSRDAVVVHKVRLRRDGQVIDVLKRQSFEVIRQEPELSEIVTGVLTAAIQPEDMRIGDVIEFAYTTTHSDPVLKGHSDITAGLPYRATGRVRLRAVLPAAGPTRWRLGEGLPAATVTQTKDGREVSVALNDTVPPKLASGAPRRLQPRYDVQITGFGSWSDVSALVAPLFQTASVLAPDSPLKAEAARIRAAYDTPKARAAAALRLVQDKVRYLARTFADGGYTPVAADKTWERKYGECKAKTVLLIALLRELGIEAEPVLVSSYNGINVNRVLPSAGAFDHVIARAVIDGRTYWLDGTRTGDGVVDVERVPAFKWGLPLRPAGAELVELKVPMPSRPQAEISYEIDARAGVEAPAPVRGTMTVRGDAAVIGLFADNLPNAELRDEMYRQAWRTLPGLEPKLVSATRDPDTGDTRIDMVGVIKLSWFASPTGRAWLLLSPASVGRTREFKRPPEEDQTAPWSVGFPLYSATRISVRLPGGGRGFAALAPDVDRAVAGQQLFRRSRTEGDTITVEASVRSLVDELSAADAQAANPAIRELGKQLPVIEAPRFYRPTSADADAWMDETLTTVPALVRRAGRLFAVGRVDPALVDINQALDLEPRNATALSLRGMMRLAKDDLPGARKDLDEAAGIEPRNGAVQHGRGQVALRDERYDDAIEAFTRAADLSPGNLDALLKRTGAYLALEQMDKALADLDEAIKANPAYFEAEMMRAGLLAAVGRPDEALKMVDEVLKQGLVDAQALILRGEILARLGRADEADQAYAASIALQPTVSAYLTRAAYRPPEQTDLRLRDVDAAAALDADAVGVESTRVRILLDGGRDKDAMVAAERALKAHPGNKALQRVAARAQVRVGRADLADRTFDEMRKAAAGDARALNNVCWELATLNHRLDDALDACDAALKLRPKDGATLDSRAFVLLRQGRNAESLAAYDEALRVRPYEPNSLYGRGLAKRRLGGIEESDADLKAALKTNFRIGGQFRTYGLTP